MIFLNLFWTFFKIGAFTFGGGYAMLPLIQEEVLNKSWMSAEEIVDFIAVSESTPGPFAINTATYVGTIMGGETFGVFGGVFGAFCATLGVVMPSFIIILLVARIYEKFNKSLLVKGMMKGLKPAVIGLIASAVLSIGQTAFLLDFSNILACFNAEFYCAFTIFILASVLIFKKVNPIIVILISAGLGIVAGYFIL